jgi:hypothetical protein
MALRQSSDPNTDWCACARAGTWFPVIDDVVTGGVRSSLCMTPISKLAIRMSGLALVGRIICATGGAGMPTTQPRKKRRLDDVACVYPNAAGRAECERCEIQRRALRCSTMSHTAHPPVQLAFAHPTRHREVAQRHRWVAPALPLISGWSAFHNRVCAAMWRDGFQIPQVPHTPPAKSW